MKKFIILTIGLLVACAAGYALPKDDTPTLKEVIKTELSHFDAIADEVSADVNQVEVDACLSFILDVQIEAPVKAINDYIVIDEGKPRSGHRQIFNPELTKHTPKGLLDKDWCYHNHLLRYRSDGTSALGSAVLIE